MRPSAHFILKELTQIYIYIQCPERSDIRYALPPTFMRLSAYFILRVLTQIYISHVPDVRRLDTPCPPVYIRPSAHFILRVLTQIYIPHVPNVQRLDTPCPPVYIRPQAHYITQGVARQKRNKNILICKCPTNIPYGP